MSRATVESIKKRIEDVMKRMHAADKKKEGYEKQAHSWNKARWNLERQQRALTETLQEKVCKHSKVTTKIVVATESHYHNERKYWRERQTTCRVCRKMVTREKLNEWWK